MSELEVEESKKMENSLENEEQENKSLCSPPRRRRSTFFIRRDSLVPLAPCDNIDPNESMKEIEETSKQEEQLKRYCEQLTIEKNQWKEEVNNRRHKYHDLRQQYQLAAKAPSRSRISYASLSNEDIEFLKGKHNITKLIDSQSNLHKTVELTREVYKRVVELDNVFINYVEEKLNKVTEYVLENSTVEPME